MIVGSKLTSSKGFSNLQDQLLNSTMDVRTARTPTPHRKLEYCRSLSQGHGGKMSRYFTSESLCLLVCLTVSLLILPLVLPPLPPPPFLLLLLPICMLALLMILAFMPSKVRDVTYTYV
ncbi:hypothetical protein CDL12_06290 [Handroanthus impetiginosus]|uniref:ARGOS-like protein n=1 Tax=Handroanthus impetiginosus TaxID=429701 RepID=A0A2G9HU21_9LAMI|nr:hypothetical protein CDL12_06290 [Handroanthus impetiginosus]